MQRTGMNTMSPWHWWNLYRRMPVFSSRVLSISSVIKICCAWIGWLGQMKIPHSWKNSVTLSLSCWRKWAIQPAHDEGRSRHRPHPYAAKLIHSLYPSLQYTSLALCWHVIWEFWSLNQEYTHWCRVWHYHQDNMKEDFDIHQTS